MPDTPISPRDIGNWINILRDRAALFETAIKSAGFNPQYGARPEGTVNLFGHEYPAARIAEMGEQIRQFNIEILPYIHPQSIAERQGPLSTAYDANTRALLQFEQIVERGHNSNYQVEHTSRALRSIGIAPAANIPELEPTRENRRPLPTADYDRARAAYVEAEVRAAAVVYARYEIDRNTNPELAATDNPRPNLEEVRQRANTSFDTRANLGPQGMDEIRNHTDYMRTVEQGGISRITNHIDRIAIQNAPGWADTREGNPYNLIPHEGIRENLVQSRANLQMRPDFSRMSPESIMDIPGRLEGLPERIQLAVAFHGHASANRGFLDFGPSQEEIRGVVDRISGNTIPAEAIENMRQATQTYRHEAGPEGQEVRRQAIAAGSEEHQRNTSPHASANRLGGATGLAMSAPRVAEQVARAATGQSVDATQLAIDGAGVAVDLTAIAAPLARVTRHAGPAGIAVAGAGSAVQAYRAHQQGDLAGVAAASTSFGLSTAAGLGCGMAAGGLGMLSGPAAPVVAPVMATTAAAGCAAIAAPIGHWLGRQYSGILSRLGVSGGTEANRSEPATPEATRGAVAQAQGHVRQN